MHIHFCCRSLTRAVDHVFISFVSSKEVNTPTTCELKVPCLPTFTALINASVDPKIKTITPHNPT